MGVTLWPSSSRQACVFSLSSSSSLASLPSLSTQRENPRRNLRSLQRSLQSLQRSQEDLLNQVDLRSLAREAPNRNQSQQQYLTNIQRKRLAACVGGTSQGRIVPSARATLSPPLRNVDSRCTTSATRKERDAHGLVTRCPHTAPSPSTPSPPLDILATGTTATSLALGANRVPTSVDQATAREAFVLQRRLLLTKCVMDRSLAAIKSQLGGFLIPDGRLMFNFKNRLKFNLEPQSCGRYLHLRAQSEGEVLRVQ